MKARTDKHILVIGGTGAQGLAVVKALLEPTSDGASSPYGVRILTRDPEHPKVKAELTHPNIELVQGSFTDLAKVEYALEGVWGAYVNTDGFTVGEKAETYYGLRIFELAVRVPTLKHYVWSNLDYGLKKGGYRPEYHCGHYDGKGRIGDWLTTKPFSTQADAFKWTVFTNGPYAEMLFGGNFLPKILDDGTRVFAAPLAKGHIPIITLSDLGHFARYIFTEVTGLPAIYQPVTYPQWLAAHPWKDAPAAVEDPGGMSFADNFRAWWKLFEDDVCTRDMEFCRRLHPGLQDIATWIRATGYDGRPKPLLKTFVDAAAKTAAHGSRG
jgi:NmrA-like family